MTNKIDTARMLTMHETRIEAALALLQMVRNELTDNTDLAATLSRVSIEIENGMEEIENALHRLRSRNQMLSE